MFTILIYTDLFINNGTLGFANKIKTIDHIGLIHSGIHIYPMLQVSCKLGNDIQKIKVIARILVKDTKTCNDEKSAFTYTGMHCYAPYFSRLPLERWI